MKKYIEKKRYNGDTIEIEFHGPDPDNYSIDKGILSDYLLRRTSGFFNKTKWELKIKDQLPPSQVWNGYNLISIAPPHIYVGIGKSIRKIDIEFGQIIQEREYANSSILKIDKYENNLLIEYSWCDMESKTEENFFCIDSDCKILWTFPRKNDSSIVVDFEKQNDDLILWTFDCFRYVINPENGNILSREWTK